MPSPSHSALRNRRREFLRNTVRLGALGVLGVVAVILGRRASRSPVAAGCRGSGVCEGCAFVAGCGAVRPVAAPKKTS